VGTRKPRIRVEHFEVEVKRTELKLWLVFIRWEQIVLAMRIASFGSTRN
jgi:hypothetical protein